MRAVRAVVRFLYRSLGLILLCCGIAHAVNSEAPAPAGKIDLVAGELQIIEAGKSRPGHTGDAVFQGDTLVTGKDSEAHLTLADSGFIALRANTRMQVVSFRADGGEQDAGVFKLFSGAMRSITGWIGKYNRRAYLLRTPTATIGIRGTDHETRYVPPGSGEGESGTYDKVFFGETTIQSDTGQTVVDPDQAGFAANDGEAEPRVLAGVPGFFRPGPHEALINAKHAEIQKLIEQRREERRKVVEQKRAELDAARDEVQAQSAANKAAFAARTAAGQAQKQDSEQQQAAFQARADDLQKRAAAIQEKRRALEQDIVPAARRGGLRDEFKPVWARGKTFAPEYQAIREARAAVTARSAAATEARNAAAQAQKKDSDARLAVLNATSQDLQQRQQSLQAQRDALEKQAAKSKPADLAPRREALRKQGEALAVEQKQNQAGYDALFYDNVGKAEARVLEAQQQSKQDEDERAALNDREASVRERQRINESKLESLEVRAIANINGAQALYDRESEIREGIEALNAERLVLQGERLALHEKYVAATRARQAEALAQLQALRAKHRGMEDRRSDLQNEVAAMNEEIRGLFEAEQRRYAEELRADREQGG